MTIMSATPTEETELLVAGAGPGGYVAAIRAARHGVDVTLADPEGVGGTCLNHGCIPSKAYIAATDRINNVVDAAEMGIYADPYVDPAELTEWKDGVVDRLTSGVEGLCGAAGVTVAKGRITFRDKTTAAVDTGDREYAVGFENAVVATGSRPIELDGFSFEDDPILDSRMALNLTNVPDDLLIVGAGYIGMELATMFRKLGIRVTVVEMEDRVLPGYEADLAAVVRDRAEDLGIDFQIGHVATGWTETDGGIRVTTKSEDDAETTYNAEAVLVAVGREPVTEGLGLDALSVDTTDRGFVTTDAQGRTDCDGVFAIGDAAGEPMPAHEATMAGEVVADVVAGHEATMEDQPIPAAVFTDPEIATVGLTEAEAREAGYKLAVGKFPFSANGRSLSLGEDKGFARIVADAETGHVLGAQLVGPEASELVAELTLMVRHGLTVEDLATTVHTHPTLAEAVMEAAEGAFGTSTHYRT